MTSVDTTATASAAAPSAPAAAPAPAASNVFTQIEATLSADWQKVVAWMQNAQQNIGTFLAKVATGAEIFVEDITGVSQWVSAHASIINGTIGAVQAVASAVAPNNPMVTKVVSDLQTGVSDVAALSTALATGVTASDPQVVTTAVTAINAVNQLSSLASSASQTLAALTANSPNATASVTVASQASV